MGVTLPMLFPGCVVFCEVFDVNACHSYVIFELCRVLRGTVSEIFFETLSVMSETTTCSLIPNQNSSCIPPKTF